MRRGSAAALNKLMQTQARPAGRLLYARSSLFATAPPHHDANKEVEVEVEVAEAHELTTPVAAQRLLQAKVDDLHAA